MRIGVISRIIGVPPSDPHGTIAAYGGTGGVLEQYPSSSGSIINYAGGYVQLGGDIYFQFTSTVNGELAILNSPGEWELVDPDDGYARVEPQSVIIGNNCVRFIAPNNATYSNVSIKVKNQYLWYYTYTNELAIPEFVVLGYLLTEYPTGAYLGYSLRKLEENATKCVRVRRTSDNTQQDIGFAGDYLDEASLSAFCGVSTGYVTKIYNQVTDGASGNLEQADTAKQPIIWTGTAVPTYTSSGKTNKVIRFTPVDGSAANTDTMSATDLTLTNCNYYHFAGVFAANAVYPESSNPSAVIFTFTISGEATARLRLDTGNGSIVGQDTSTLRLASTGYAGASGGTYKDTDPYMAQTTILVAAATDDGFGGSNNDGTIDRMFTSIAGTYGVGNISGESTILPPYTGGNAATFTVGVYNKSSRYGSPYIYFCEMVLWKDNEYMEEWDIIKDYQKSYFNVSGTF